MDIFYKGVGGGSLRERGGATYKKPLAPFLKNNLQILLNKISRAW